MKILMALVISAGLVLSGCSFNPFSRPTDRNSEALPNQPAGEKTGMANPASIFCAEQGGTLKIEEDESGGQFGNCVLADGTICEEWSYYRGQCSSKDENEISVGNENIKISGIRSGETYASPMTVAGVAQAAENKVIVELRNSARQTLVKETASIRATEMGKAGPFSINLSFQFSGTKEGYLAVYEPGADGSQLNLVEIPIKFAVNVNE